MSPVAVGSLQSDDISPELEITAALSDSSTTTLLSIQAVNGTHAFVPTVRGLLLL